MGNYLFAKTSDMEDDNTSIDSLDIEEINKDGQEEDPEANCQEADGQEVDQEADGQEVNQEADGQEVDQEADGQEVNQEADGQEVDQEADGQEEDPEADGQEADGQEVDQEADDQEADGQEVDQEVDDQEAEGQEVNPEAEGQEADGQEVDQEADDQEADGQEVNPEANPEADGQEVNPEANPEADGQEVDRIRHSDINDFFNACVNIDTFMSYMKSITGAEPLIWFLNQEMINEDGTHLGTPLTSLIDPNGFSDLDLSDDEEFNTRLTIIKYLLTYAQKILYLDVRKMFLNLDVKSSIGYGITDMTFLEAVNQLKITPGFSPNYTEFLQHIEDYLNKKLF